VQPHATPTRSASGQDDHGNNRGNDNESTEDRQVATPSATCDRDADEVAGDRHGDPNAPDDDAVSGDRHGGDDGSRDHDGLDDDDCR
jgi:hypothetical protein